MSPRILEPTLIRTSTVLSTTGGAGATVEMDFDFGNLEGAILLAVEYRSPDILVPGAAGGIEMGLHFNGTQAAPGTAVAFVVDENMFAFESWDFNIVTSGGLQASSPVVDLRPFDILIARNIALQIFVAGAATLGVVAAIYYKRAQFSEAEVGGIVAFRR